MIRIRAALYTALMSMILLPVLTSAQTDDGSIEASWKRAPSQPAPSEHRMVPPPPPSQEADRSAMEYTKTTWDAERSPASRPWPKLTAQSSAREYFDANAVVIDSLASLYCISSNYISTLRIRNQQAMQGREPQLKEFAYEEGEQPVPTASARTSLHALHKELLQLLERCLVGR
jgi:hypothetical protein